jgi:hypothetical protein
MKNLFTILLSAITASLVTIWLQKPEQKSERKSRKITEFAPSFKKLEKEFSGDEELYEDHRKAWIKFVREAVQANLTELEADQVAQAILEYEAPAYNYFEPLFPAHEKEEPGDEEE